MRIISLLLLVFVISVNCLFAQSYVTTVKVDKEKMAFTARPGSASRPDTITITAGRIGGRFKTYFEGDNKKYFHFVGPILHKVKRYDTITMALVFDPPAGFAGEAKAKLRVQGISLHTWALIDLTGKLED